MSPLAILLGLVPLAADPPIRPDLPYAIALPPSQVRFVRVVIDKSSGGEPCIDELEVYGPHSKQNLALASRGAKASASSCIAGYPEHAVAHLNDGQYGNEASWVAGPEQPAWAQIELPEPAVIDRVVLSRDRKRQYADRVPLGFEIQVSMDGRSWQAVRRVATQAAPVVMRVRQGRFVGVVPPPPPPPSRFSSRGRGSATGLGELQAARRDEAGLANLALRPQAKAAASSLLPGYVIHQVPHLNDGRLGNSHSWISNGEPSWAEIDLGDTYWVCHVAFGSDSSGQYRDRAATRFSILVAGQRSPHSGEAEWRPVYRHEGSPVHTRTSFRFAPVEARWVRVAIESSNQDQVRIDELEVFGQKEPIPPDKARAEVLAVGRPAIESPEMLEYAFLGEEHAWLKAFGRADLSPRLVPYNGRVKEYPRHVGDDRLPLASLCGGAVLDGRLDDACWQSASRGVARVADPYDFAQGPLVCSAVWAGLHGEHLYLGLEIDRLLSAHLAVVSLADGLSCGVVVWTEQGLRFNTFAEGGKQVDSRPVEGAADAAGRRFELRLPLAWFPGWQQAGWRIGLGMGGRHTPPEGRAVWFTASSLSVAEVGHYQHGAFRVRFRAAGRPVRVAIRQPLRDNPSPQAGQQAEAHQRATEAESRQQLSEAESRQRAAEAEARQRATEAESRQPAGEESWELAPGQTRVLQVTAEAGPIGPQATLCFEDSGGEPYVLHLFRYDPLGRTLALASELATRLEARGIDVSAERAALEALRKRHAGLLAGPPERAAERGAFFQARQVKRRLLFRDPELRVLEKILFVKRHAYEPSHNYSVMLDAPWRPGGGIYRLEIPWQHGRLDVGQARLVELFRSGAGIARDPMATFEADRIYFAYRKSQDDYFRILRMDAFGRQVEQLTSGPFHDYWPCPLPDGGLAFISTRCRARYLCWRPQAAVLFRMNPDGTGIRPLSFANLSEWAPSVTRDGRIIWTRSEYIDKGADFSHTLWTIRPDGTMPELVFGNTIIQPNGYANGREVPGTSEICCTLISHFGDLNGPIALVDVHQGRFNPKAIRSLTPEVPWPGMWPECECFRDPVPVARDYVLCSHAPRRQFGLYVIDRYGNREVLYQDLAIGSMCPTPLRPVPRPPVLRQDVPAADSPWGHFVLADVYRGLEPAVPRGSIKFLRVVEEVRSHLEQLPNGEYRKDHEPFLRFYASPVDLVSGPYGWPSYVAKAPWGLVQVEGDGSASFLAPAGKTLYFQALDENLNEVQRMRSVVQVQPGEQRSCIGCHEDRRHAPPGRPMAALRRPPQMPEPPPWGPGPLDYQRAVQPVWDAKCVRCHAAGDKHGIDLSGTLDADRIPASYKTLIRQGWVHVLDCGWNSGGNEKRQPYTFGTFQSRLWKVLDAGHYDVRLNRDEMHAVKCWIDLNCPLWPDYRDRLTRPLAAGSPAAR